MLPYFLLCRPKLSKIDRSSQQCHTISVNSLSVVIKEYIPNPTEL